MGGQRARAFGARLGRVVLTAVVLSVTLANPTGGATLGRATGTGTIVDDDPASAVLGIGDATVVEGNVGAVAVPVAVPVAVTLSQPSAAAVTLGYSTTVGTADAGDFVEVANGTLTIPAGASSANALITVISGTVPEPTETFTITLSSPSGATIDRTTATVTILDDD